MTRRAGIPLLLGAALLAACGSDATGPGNDGRSVPPPGPHFTVLPLPLEAVARITPIGYNNKRFPTPHTYWLLCDDFFILQSSRPCRMERMANRVRRILRKHGYPPDKQEKATQTVLERAEVLSAEWATA